VNIPRANNFKRVNEVSVTAILMRQIERGYARKFKLPTGDRAGEN
jgi:hypothetical protein